jgi:hypothetical protein
MLGAHCAFAITDSYPTRGVVAGLGSDGRAAKICDAPEVARIPLRVDAGNGIESPETPVSYIFCILFDLK